jgi:hypothetical protein
MEQDLMDKMLTWLDYQRTYMLLACYVLLLNCRHNGEYVQTYGLMEQDLMDKMLTWLDYQRSSSQPFFLYYAPNAIHRYGACWVTEQRGVPPPQQQQHMHLFLLDTLWSSCIACGCCQASPKSSI